MVFPVVMYGCESWTIKKDEHQRIDAFELWCWRRRWNSNTLATWCEELTHWKRPWCWERLKAGGEGDDRGWDVWMASPTRWTWAWVNSGRWWWTGRPGVLRVMGLQRLGHNWATELNWLNHEEILDKSKLSNVILTRGKRDVFFNNVHVLRQRLWKSFEIKET